METNNQIDYTTNFNKIEIIVGDAKGYATINEVYSAEEYGIEPCGEFFVYLLHPQRGTQTFTLWYDYDYETWVPEDLVTKELIEPEILQQIIDAIPVRKNKISKHENN